MTLLTMLFVLLLASFLGAELISKVPQTLHTPLMSGTNAVSGITILGALIVAGAAADPWVEALGLGAIFLATVNVVGGFAVTDRMLGMFRRREPGK